jgi:hypothetical protein
MYASSGLPIRVRDEERATAPTSVVWEVLSQLLVYTVVEQKALLGKSMSFYPLVDTSRCVHKGHHPYSHLFCPNGSDQALSQKVERTCQNLIVLEGTPDLSHPFSIPEWVQDRVSDAIRSSRGEPSFFGRLSGYRQTDFR